MGVRGQGGAQSAPSDYHYSTCCGAQSSDLGAAKCRTPVGTELACSCACNHWRSRNVLGRAGVGVDALASGAGW